MKFEEISSKDNRLIKKVKKLSECAKERKTQSEFILEGLRLCLDAVINGYTIDTVIISEKTDICERINKIINSALHCVIIPEKLFNYICDTVTPQGVLCIVKKPEFSININNCKGKYVILENINNPANLGAISRTAEALGVSGIIISQNSCDPYSPKSLRASMGALLRLPIIISNDFLHDLTALSLRGYKLFAAVVSDADCDVSEVEYTSDCAVVIGNEANGISNDVKSLCNKKITINMKGRAESLNAAAAAAIIMWEMTRGCD